MHRMTMPSWFMTGFYNMASVIPAVVLAAGRSSRMGRAKATLPLGDADTFLSRIVRTFLAAGVDDVIVVVGHEPPAIIEVRAAAMPLKNGRSSRNATSFKVGVNHVGIGSLSQGAVDGFNAPVLLIQNEAD